MNYPVAIFFGFGPWKSYIRRWFPERACKVVSRKPWRMIFGGWPLRLVFIRRAEVFVWGYKYPPFLKHFCRLFGIRFNHVEDGFVRSISLGAQKATPASLMIDARAMHYDARRGSDLEHTLQTYDFGADEALMARADKCIRMFLDLRISKYNLGKQVALDDILGPKTNKRVLVVGQVETDAAILFGCDRTINNNDLVRLAAAENPGAQVIYKPHPELLHGKRKGLSNPADVAHLCQILAENLAPADVFDGVDHVYTITSLMGFEALLRDIPVTCYGVPFYAGWGMTDDRQRCTRRTRKLSAREIFAASYLMHSRYFDPETGEPTEFEMVVERLNALRSTGGVRRTQGMA